MADFNFNPQDELDMDEIGQMGFEDYAHEELPAHAAGVQGEAGAAGAAGAAGGMLNLNNLTAAQLEVLAAHTKTIMDQTISMQGSFTNALSDQPLFPPRNTFTNSGYADRTLTPSEYTQEQLLIQNLLSLTHPIMPSSANGGYGGSYGGFGQPGFQGAGVGVEGETSQNTDASLPGSLESLLRAAEDDRLNRMVDAYADFYEPDDAAGASASGKQAQTPPKKRQRKKQTGNFDHLEGGGAAGGHGGAGAAGAAGGKPATASGRKFTEEDVRALFVKLPACDSYHKAYRTLNDWHREFNTVPQVPKDMIRFKQHLTTCFPFLNDELVALYHEIYTMVCPVCMAEHVTTAAGVVTRHEMLVEHFPRQMCEHRRRGSQTHRTEKPVKGKRDVPCLSIERALETFHAPKLAATCAQINANAKHAREQKAALAAGPAADIVAAGSTGGPAFHPECRA